MSARPAGFAVAVACSSGELWALGPINDPEGMLYFLLDISRDWLEAKGLYTYVQVLDRVSWRALMAAALAFLIVLCLGPRVVAFLRRKKIGDAGLTDAELLRRAAQSKANIPTMGGVLIIGALLLATLLLADITNRYVVLACVVAVWLAVLGSFDDWLKLTAASRPGGSRQGLFAWEKLVFQLGLGAIIGYFVFRHGHPAELKESLAAVVNLPFQRTYEPDKNFAVNPSLWFLGKWVFVAWAVIFIAGMSNAVNITDGMDGLASGLSAAVAFAMLALCLIAGTQAWAQGLLLPFVPQTDELAVVAGAMAGACLGFLWFNCVPAQVFMGDTGSLALGGLLAFMALCIRQEALLLIVSVFFLMEMFSVIIQVGYFKMSGGKRVFRCAPYHHHLHLGGWAESQVVVRAWIITLLMVVLAFATVKVR